MTTEPTIKAGKPLRRAYNVADFCAAYGLGHDVVYDAIRNNKLIARKLGARTIITADDGDKFIVSLPRLELPPSDRVVGVGVAHPPRRDHKRTKSAKRDRPAAE